MSTGVRDSNQDLGVLAAIVSQDRRDLPDGEEGLPLSLLADLKDQIHCDEVSLECFNSEQQKGLSLQGIPVADAILPLCAGTVSLASPRREWSGNATRAMPAGHPRRCGRGRETDARGRRLPAALVCVANEPARSVVPRRVAGVRRAGRPAAEPAADTGPTAPP